jgi:YbbR domain-containing protein
MTIREFITKDLSWKIASIVFAVIIWAAVYNYRQGTPEFGGRVRQTTYGDVPVLIVSTAGDARSYHVAPDKVSVTVSGPDNIMTRLQANEIQPFVDVTGKESAGFFRATVTVSLPKGVTLVDVNPSWIGVTPPGH